MTMNVTRLTTYWTTDEAATAIDFLDNLRDVLWEAYGERITLMQREAHDEQIRDLNQREIIFDDDDIF
mgnify:FL=1